MSSFGDHTPATEIEEAVSSVQYKYQLSDEEVVTLLIEVLSYANGNFSKFDRVQAKPERDS